jgi:hypothetical protein
MAHRIRVAHWLVAGGLLLAASPAFRAGRHAVQESDGKRHRRQGRRRYRISPAPAAGRAAGFDPAAPAGGRASARNAAWPNDPDVAARRADNARTRWCRPPSARSTRTTAPAAEPGRAPPRPSSGRPRQQGVPAAAAPMTRTSARSGPAATWRRAATRICAKLVYGSEPERKYLYEPPVGYRRPAGSAPLGPGRGPREDTQAFGQKEFVRGHAALPPSVSSGVGMVRGWPPIWS